MSNIQIGELAETIARNLTAYSKEVAEGVKEAVDETADELLNNTRADAPEESGKYKKAMRIKTAYESATEKRKVWYVAAPRHTLAHLLEDPHKTRSGGTTRAFPHIRKNAEKATKDFTQRVEEVIKNNGR